MCCGIRLRSSHHPIIYTPFNLQLATKLSSIQFTDSQPTIRQSKLKRGKSVKNKMCQSDGITFHVHWISISRRKIYLRLSHLRINSKSASQRERGNRNGREIVHTALLACPIGPNKIQALVFQTV